MGTVSAVVSGLVSLVWTLFLIVAAVFLGIHVARELPLQDIPLLGRLPDFLAIPLQNQSESIIISTLAGVLAGFLLLFLTAYVWQALWDGLRLGLVRGSLKRANRKGRFRDAGFSLIDWGWFHYPLVSRLWREYAETLHRQPSPGPRDEMGIQYRSTQPAEVVFGQQVLVDVPMRVEFFRHLPGILTGAGIVSTFAGILLGLSNFNPAVPVDQVTHQLKLLFSGVTTAFVASFFAILTAIIVTVMEKLLIHWRYAQVTAFQCQLDDLFRAGVEPEYLADLVAGGVSGFEGIRLELGRVTTTLDGFVKRSQEGVHGAPAGGAEALEMFKRLLATEREATVRAVGEGIHDALAGPLATLTRALEGIGNGAGPAVNDGSSNRLLETELARIGGKLDDGLDVSNHQSRLFEQILATAEETVAASGEQTEKNRQQRIRELQIFRHLGKTLEALPAQLVPADDLVRSLKIGQEAQTEALKRLNESLEALQTKIPAGDELARLIRTTQEAQTEVLKRLGDSMEDLPGRMPSGDELARQLKSVQSTQTEVLKRLGESMESLPEKMPSGDELVRVLKNGQAAQTEALNRLGESVAGLPDKMPSSEALAKLLRESQAAQTEVLKKLGESLETLPEKMPSNRDLTALLKQGQDRHSEALDRLGERVASLPENLPSAKEIGSHLQRAGEERNRILLEEVMGTFSDRLNQTVLGLTEQLTGLGEGIAKERQTMASTLDRVSEEVNETGHEWETRLAAELERAMGEAANRQMEMMTALRTLSEQTESELGQFRQRLHDAEGDQAETHRLLSEKIVTSISDRLEETFGSVSEGLEALRQRFSEERRSMDESMRQWLEEAARGKRDESAEINKKVQEMVLQVDGRHEDMIGVIDRMNRQLAHELEAMRDGLLEKNDRMGEAVSRQVRDLGESLEGVVTGMGREQAVFIEMLGERLNALRKRLKIK